MKKCKEEFIGTVYQFIKEYEDNFLTPKQMKRAHEQVVDALNLDLYLVRAYSSNKYAGEEYSSSCGSVNYTVGDNEPVVWFWRNIYNK